MKKLTPMEQLTTDRESNPGLLMSAVEMLSLTEGDIIHAPNESLFYAVTEIYPEGFKAALYESYYEGVEPYNAFQMSNPEEAIFKYKLYRLTEDSFLYRRGGSRGTAPGDLYTRQIKWEDVRRGYMILPVWADKNNFEKYEKDA